jgi:hypothetical protein
MLHNTDTAAGVAYTSAPGLLYVIVRYLLDLPIEKWVSAWTLIFVVLQVAFLLVDRLKKRRGKRIEK